MLNWNFCPSKISRQGLPQDARDSDVGSKEAPSMRGDNSLYLLMTTIRKLRSKWSWPTSTAHCYCLIFCNPFQAPWSRPIHWLVAWEEVMELKEVVIILHSRVGIFLLSFNNFSLCLLSSSKKGHKHSWSSYSIFSICPQWWCRTCGCYQASAQCCGIINVVR